jgi:hypothetical protein
VIDVLAAAHPGDASGFLVRDGQLSGKSVAGVLIRADIGWETLWANAIGSMWGRTAAGVEIVGIDPWVLRAELSR